MTFTWFLPYQLLFTVEVRHIRYFLISISDFHSQRLAEFLYPITDHSSEVCLYIMSDDEDDLIKTGSYRIVDAVVDDKMAIVINWCKLFYSAAKPGTNSRDEDYERFVHFFPLQKHHSK